MGFTLVTSVAHYSTGKEYHKTAIQLLLSVRINLSVHCRCWKNKNKTKEQPTNHGALIY